MATLNVLALLPEMGILGMTCLLLLVAAFVPKLPLAISYFLAQLALVLASLASLSQLHVTAQISLHGAYISDPLAQVAKLVLYALGFWVFLYARDYIKTRTIPAAEFYVLSLFSLLGMMVLVSAQHFLVVYLGLELLSLPLYALVALQRDSALATEASIKYFVMGALASGMLLYGLSMIYGATGSLEIGAVAQAIGNVSADHRLVLLFGLVFIVVGLAFKLGAAPFHMWVPDVYHGAPLGVTLLLSSAPKVAGFVMLVRLLIYAMPSLQAEWQQLWLVIALLSIGVGNVAAIAQDNIKRMLAYSSIAHVGYLILGILAGTYAGYAAAFFYVISYALMSLGAFAVLVLLSQRGVEVEQITDLRGLHARNPWLALMMLLFMFSMAGIPPTVGFLAKLGVLATLVQQQQIWVAVVAMLFSVIGAFYYLRVVRVMYFEAPDDELPVALEWDNRLAISANGLLILWLGVFPSGLLQLCRGVF